MVEAKHLAITEFSLYSIGIILTSLQKDTIFEDFLKDTFDNAGVTKVRFETKVLKRVISVRREFSLDFDDSYQYLAAEEFGYTIVSFDKDFDKTELGRKTPSEVLNSI